MKATGVLMSSLTEEQQQIVEQYSFLISLVVERLASALRHRGFSAGDMTGPGALGLCEAAMKFDSKRSCPFEPFAKRLIRYRIYDALGIHGAMVRRHEWIENNHTPLSTIPDLPGPDNVEREAIRNERARKVRNAARHLSPRARRVIHRSYFDGASLNVIAAEMGVTKGRVWQIRKNALDFLRDRFRAA